MDTTNAQLNVEAAGDPWRFVALWYRDGCVNQRDDDGARPDGPRISVEVVDGPGWWVSIDLRGTGLEGQRLDAALVDRGVDGWWQYWSTGQTFTVATSMLHLAEGLAEFRRFALAAELAPWEELLTG